jgi:hypothetical protein
MATLEEICKSVIEADQKLGKDLSNCRLTDELVELLIDHGVNITRALLVMREALKMKSVHSDMCQRGWMDRVPFICVACEALQQAEEIMRGDNGNTP